MKPNQQKPPVSKPIRIIQILMVLTALAIPITIVAWMMWHGSPKEILAVADKFKPQEGWQLKHETAYPPANFCIGQRCPSVWRQWKTSEYYSSAQMKNLLEQSFGKERSATISHVCDVEPIAASEDENSKSCEINTIIDEYVVSLRQESKYDYTSKTADNTAEIYIRFND